MQHVLQIIFQHAGSTDTAVLDPAKVSGKAKRVAVLFEQLNNGAATAVSFAVVALDE